MTVKVRCSKCGHLQDNVTINEYYDEMDTLYRVYQCEECESIFHIPPVPLCEEDGCNQDASRYEIVAINDDGSDDVHWLCDEHAPKFGFCVYCGNFSLGIGNDVRLMETGICDDCRHELESDAADYYDPDMDFGWEDLPF